MRSNLYGDYKILLISHRTTYVWNRKHIFGVNTIFFVTIKIEGDKYSKN